MYLRLALLSLFCLYFFNAALHTDAPHFIDGVNLVIHEAGHTVVFFLGEFMQVAAGSLFQVLIPTIFALYFFFRRDIFSGSLLLLWVGESVIGVGIYAADALHMNLPLLGGDSVIHDWNFLLSHLELLKYTDTIGRAIGGMGWSLMLVGVVAALSVLVEEWAEKRKIAELKFRGETLPVPSN